MLDVILQLIGWMVSFLIGTIANGVACLVVALMAMLPTLAVTFLALRGGIWIAKSF
jgi:hypothetical protein